MRRISGSYFAVRKDGARIRQQVNTTFADFATTSGFTFNVEDAYLFRHVNGSLPFKGIVAARRFYDHDLTDAEFTEAYNAVVSEVAAKGITLGEAPSDTPLPVVLPEVQAGSAKAFTEAVGIAGHTEWAEYINNWPTVKQRLVDSNIKLYRAVWNSADSIAKAKEMAAAGIKLGVSINPRSGLVPNQYNPDGTPGSDPYHQGTQALPYKLPDFLNELGPENVVFVEQPNEPNLFPAEKRRASQADGYFSVANVAVGGAKHAEYVTYLQELVRDTEYDLRSDPLLRTSNISALRSPGAVRRPFSRTTATSHSG